MKAIGQEYSRWLALGKVKPEQGSSPFYSRIYAGYTAAQLQCVVENLGEARDKTTVFDPMAGQSFALSTLSWLGHDVLVNDINPAPLLLAWLRSASVLVSLRERAEEYLDWLHSHRRKLNALHIRHEARVPFITGWLSDGMRAQISLYGELAWSGVRPQPLSDIHDWPEETLFRLAMLVLAARRTTCSSKSDNRTWLKAGGLDNKPPLADAINAELAVLLSCNLSESCRNQIGLFENERGSLRINCQDVAKGALPSIRKRCIGVTSPPYANRLDYSVMWAPELVTLATALPFVDLDAIRRNQIGTTRIRREQLEVPISHLPATTKRELKQIQESTAYASQHYYYPFFRQFALDLQKGLQHAAAAAPRAEKWIIFIRDTARKDVMFSSHAICESVMSAAGFRRQRRDDLQIIRSHIGVMRRSQVGSSVYGLAQREWWLVFERS